MLLLASLLTACGGGSPAAPSGPAGPIQESPQTLGTPDTVASGGPFDTGSASPGAEFRLEPSEVLTYAIHGGHALLADIYLPGGTPNQRLALFIHSGGWHLGDRRRGYEIFRPLIQAGYVVVSIDYRLKHQGGVFPEPVRDCRAALRWCQDNAHRYGADASQIVVLGASAGAHLAAFTALAPPNPQWDDEPGRYERPAAMVGCYGIYFFNGFFDDHPFWIQWFLGTPDNAYRATPSNYIDPDDPPALLFCGDEDEVTPLDQSIDHAERLRAVGLEAKVVVVEHARHSFEPSGGIPTPNAAERAAILLDWLDEVLES